MTSWYVAWHVPKANSLAIHKRNKIEGETKKKKIEEKGVVLGSQPCSIYNTSKMNFIFSELNTVASQLL